MCIDNLDRGEERLWRCVCGTKKRIKYADVARGRVQSCGCLNSETASRNGSMYGVHNAGTRAHKYDWHVIKGGQRITLRSGFEVVYANFLLAQGADFKYEPQTFKLGPSLRYTPDFYLPGLNEWREVKGYVSERAERKIRLFREKTGNTIRLITENELKPMIPGGVGYHTFLKRWRAALGIA